MPISRRSEAGIGGGRSGKASGETPGAIGESFGTPGTESPYLNGFLLRVGGAGRFGRVQSRTCSTPAAGGFRGCVVAGAALVAEDTSARQAPRAAIPIAAASATSTFSHATPAMLAGCGRTLHDAGARGGDPLTSVEASGAIMRRTGML